MTPRSTLTPFLRGTAWWARVPTIDGEGVRRPLGISGKHNKALARDYCTFLIWLRSRRHWLLGEIHAKRTTVARCYDAYAANRLDAFVAELRDGASDVDLEPLVAKWQKELERRKSPNEAGRAKYLRQVRTLIEAGKPFPRSRFTALRLIEWLDGLSEAKPRKVTQPNRYRAAMSSFADFCVLIGVLPTNPVSAVPGVRENDGRTLHLIPLDAKKLIEKMAGDPRLQAFHAAMLATGMETGAARRIDPATVTEHGVFAHGTKTATRQRTAHVYDRWRWAWTIARAYLEQHPDGSHPFASITYDESRRALKDALADAGLNPSYTPHDHRHTWAVQAIRDGLNEYVVAGQLGHVSVTMVRKVYGRFAPVAGDFRTRNSTVSDTVDLTTDAKSEAVSD